MVPNLPNIILKDCSPQAKKFCYSFSLLEYLTAVKITHLILSINGMALKLIDSMYKVRAAAKQTATDKLRKILTRKNKSKNRFNSKPQRIKPAKGRKLTGGGNNHYYWVT